MRQYKKVKAIFNPKRKDDLQEHSKNCTGNVCEFIASWIIEDGPYKGQWAMVPTTGYLGWCPLCDLEIIEETK